MAFTLLAGRLILTAVLPLQSSLTGNGARISVICTVTPASSQAEETHNTLKFATRAKKIEITAQRNEIVDQASLIRRYQEEIQTLRSQLDSVARERGGQLPMTTIAHDPLHPEVYTNKECICTAPFCISKFHMFSAVVENFLRHACLLSWQLIFSTYT